MVYIFNPNISFKALLKRIFQELGRDPGTEDVPEMVNGLHRLMIEEYQQGRSVVLIIDEAQNMPVDTLENLRMLSNLETSTDKLIQMVLVGQPEFDQILNRPELRQLKQRIGIRCKILPLTRKESLAYIRHRLQQAGGDSRQLFTKGALKKIVTRSQGIPRTINIFCDNALITGFGYRKKPVTGKIVKEVLSDFQSKARPASLRRWVLAAAPGLAFLLFIFWFSPFRSFLFPEAEVRIFSLKRMKPEVKVESGNKMAEGETPPGGISLKAEAEESVGFASRAEGKGETPAETEPDEGDKPEVKPGARPPAPKPPFPVVRMVERNDCLSRMTLSVYGRSSEQLVKWVKENNPHLRNIHLINPGDRIVFPEPLEH
jgi:general secretion pathway protein A